MTESLDIDGILDAMSNPKVADNMSSLMDGMNEVQKVMDKLDKIMQTVDRLGFKPLLVRAAGLKLGVDAESPLASEKPEPQQTGIQPMTPTHEAAMQAINALSESEVNAMLNPEGSNDTAANPEPTE